MTREEAIAKMCAIFVKEVAPLTWDTVCTGCRWRGVRPQKCSCCRRNLNMKDNYEVKE